MVCKEEVYSWFQNLKGSKRIEAMSCFLNMCYPLELRFYGTCIEDLGRKDFYIFKDEEIRANDYSEILKIKNIHDTASRSKLIVVLSLLNSSNTLCAKELFNVLCEEMKIETLITRGIFSDLNLVDQYLLVLTLAQHHPAFTFEQQTFLTQLSISVESYSKELQSRSRYEDVYQPSSVDVLPQQRMPERMLPNAPHSFHFTSPRYSNSHSQVQITSLKVKPPHKKTCIRIRVVWGGNKSTDAFKTPHELFVFHQKLIQLYPTEAKNNNQDKCIPPIPQLLTVGGNKQNPLPESVVCAAAEYIQQLNSRLPGYVLESEFVRNFFMPSYPNRAVLTRNTRSAENVQNDIPPRSSRLRSLTIYNSQISENPPRHRSENKQKVLNSRPRKQFENGSNVCSLPSPINSPIESPLSSPYTSPVNSATNSRPASPWNVATGADRNFGNVCAEPPSVEKVQMKEIPDEWNASRNYKIEELQAMPIEDLDSLGLLKDSGTVYKELERKSPPNGLIGCYIPKGTLLLKSSPLLPPNSNDSSPACSEYSSPPQSPSPGEPCNQSSSLSSGTEENTEKKSLSKTLAEICKIDESAPGPQESLFKRTDDESVCMKGNMNRAAISVIPFAVPYSSIVSQLPPPQNMKPAYLPIPCRTNTTPQHISPNAVVFDKQFSRVPLPSALTFIPAGLPPRSHTATSPGLSSVTTVSPFPIVTSGCTTVPSASCSITTHRSSNVTAVTNSGMPASSRYTSKNSSLVREGEMPKAQGAETPYATGYILNSTSLTTVSCSCFTTNSARPSPAPSPSIISAPQPSGVSVSMSYLGMPYLFHSIPFLHTQAPSNGFVQQPGIANSGQAFGYTLQNGITAISPELIYPGQAFAMQPPTTQGAATPVTQCYGAFSQTAAVPIKLVTCYNCGKVGHRGPECKEQTMDDINKQGKFQLNYNPVPKMPDSHD